MPQVPASRSGTSLLDLLMLAKQQGPQVPLPSGEAGDMGDPTTLANRLDNPSVMDSLPLKALRQGSKGVATIGNIVKGMVTGGSEEPGVNAENFGAILAAMGPLFGKIVYHGSPHVFDRFDMRKIGTGEGNQSYGHGLYFADQADVARAYRPYVNGISVGGKPAPTVTIPEQMLEARLAQKFENGHSNPIAGVRAGLSLDLDQIASPAMRKEYEEASRLLEKWNASGIEPNQAGMLADVDLPDDAIAKMLGWDAPLSQQPEAVRAAVAPMLERARRSFPQLEARDSMTGSDVYKVIQSHRGGDASAVSQSMREAGIPGIRYYDGASRGKAGGELLGVERQGGKLVAKIRKYGVSGGQGNMPADIFTTSKPYGTEAEARKWAEDAIAGGTRNYVVFDDQLPKIVKVTR